MLEPHVPWPFGDTRVVDSCTWMRVMGMPRPKATACATFVNKPWPISAPLVVTRTTQEQETLFVPNRAIYMGFNVFQRFRFHTKTWLWIGVTAGMPRPKATTCATFVDKS